MYGIPPTAPTGNDTIQGQVIQNLKFVEIIFDFYSYFENPYHPV
jgi:hypothetical protein